MTEAPEPPELPAATYDPQTLHDGYGEPDGVRDRIQALRVQIREAPDEIGELVARGDLVVLLRSSDALDEALDEARAAADRAQIAGTPAQQHVARVRLAHVHQWRGEFAESNLGFVELLSAVDQFGPVIDAFTHHHAGLNDYDQRHWADAREHFARALAIRDEFELPDAERAASRIALDAAERQLGADDEEDP